MTFRDAQSRPEGWGEPSVSVGGLTMGKEDERGFALAQEVREESGRWLRREEDECREKHNMFQMW